MKVQLENGNKSPFTNWKYNSNQKMEIKVHLRIGKNIQLENGNKSPFMNWKYNSDQKMESSFKNQGKSPIGKMEIIENDKWK